MVEGGGFEIHCRRSSTAGSNPALSAITARWRARRVARGEVTEWSKVHDWKSCVPQGTAGSNPALSAMPPAALPPVAAAKHPAR